MIKNTAKTIIVDGVNVSGVVYKRSNTGEVAESLTWVADGKGGYLGTGAVTITGEIKGYFIKPIMLHEGSVYDISGVVTPGDRMVYLSSGFERGSVDALRDNIIASAYADKEGNFKFSNIAYPDGTISLWVVIFAQDATTASLTYELSISDYNPNIANLLTYSFNKPEGEHKHPRYTITGTCSEDIEIIYMSITKNATSVARLMENMCCSVSPIEGTFKIEYTGEYELNYIVWSLSNKTDGYLAVNEITITNDDSVCLSGDTMITMIDGSTKRMDEICAGDIVLSKDGLPSRVHTASRGRFSNYHTLYYFEDGTIIDETHPHRFYNVNQGFWQRLQLWNIGDHAINQDGNEIALVSVERLEDNIEMFGIWTDNGTYYANGLLSGAAFCNKELLAEATAEQAIDMMLSTDEEMLVQLMGLEGVLP
jgi:hypothetical protein